VILGVLRESYPGERRVALVPAVIPNLTKAGLEVVIETGAGSQAGYLDEEYSAKGGKILPERAEIFRVADIVVQVLCYGSNDRTGKADLPHFRANQTLVGFLRPFGAREILREVASSGVTTFSVELMPRTTRAQSMDALSSMATLSGYKAAVLAADTLPRIFPMLTTAAGTITPGRVLIIGVGVAGLQAIATARRLGAVVSAYDVRPAAKEQVLSLGARFVELPIEAKDAQDARGYATAQGEEFYRKQRELLGDAVAANDIVITAAVIPGKKIANTGYERDGGTDGTWVGDRGSCRGARRKLRTDARRRNHRGTWRNDYRAIQFGLHCSLLREPDVRAQPYSIFAEFGEGRKLAIQCGG